ncbi:MAG TPA: HAD family hydrolase [Bryobacteraceae bacterium]|jgi:D-glycero-D-manno-heptose 1,7-bisphosphate phosphatase|nr:HAD family hydrolase [Bryobacteraceae bacterium]
MRQAVFFDRDGTLMEEAGYCSDPSLVRVFPAVPNALRALKQAGFLNIVISNQSGIGRGYFDEAQYRAVQDEMLRQIGDNLIDASYFCADAPDATSSCRKPEPGMLLEAARDFEIGLDRSVMIGDKSSDIECARRVGAHSVLVATGYGALQDCQPDFRATGVTDAAQWVLSHLR